MTLEELRAAHVHCRDNRSEIDRSKLCCCFYCLATYAPNTIERWLDEGRRTAFCPECQIDSVVGDASGLPVEDPAFLAAMHEFWFERIVSAEEVARAFE
jgi:hypothetical protein